MKIALLAPLWETVPPIAYGGTELVVYILCEELIKKGHDVTLYATACSKTSAKLKPVIQEPMRKSNVKFPIHCELKAISELGKDHKKFDIIHNHMGYQLLPFADFMDVPVVTTLHGAFVVKEDISFYNFYSNLNYISISNSQRKGAPDLNYISTVYNGIQIEKYPFNPEPDLKDPYLTFLGRFSEEKGPHLAIEIAKATGMKLILAGKIDPNYADEVYFEAKVKPLIDNKQIQFIGELQHKEKVELLKNSVATLHPVTWPEPFGLVMAESMACGTPVLALNQGSIPEVIAHNKTGFVENDVKSLIKHVQNIHKIDRKTCREHIKDNFSGEKMTEGYLHSYQNLINKKCSITEANFKTQSVAT